MADSFDLMVAPNGARLTRADHPAVPLSPTELARTARACAAAGATSIHLHVRDAAGRHSLAPDDYRPAIAAVSAASPLRVQITTEAAGRFSPADQLACLAALAPAAATVALREIERAPEVMARLWATAEAAGTQVQHIVYAPEELARLKAGLEAGTIPARFDRVLFVLGHHGMGPEGHARPGMLRAFLAELGDWPLKWSACAFGPKEPACLIEALEAGGDVRLGFENNIHAPTGPLWRDNAESVAHFVGLAARRGFVPRAAPLAGEPA